MSLQEKPWKRASRCHAASCVQRVYTAQSCTLQSVSARQHFDAKPAHP